MTVTSKKTPKDFQKQKAKAGKKTVRSNLTKINLKTKKIVLPSQSKITNANHNQSEREKLSSITKQLQHYSENHRIHALQEARTFIFSCQNPENYLALIYPEMLELLFKEEHECRDALIDVISSTMQLFKPESLVSVLTIIITMLCSGLSNIDKSIRRDAAMILFIFIEKSPAMLQSYRQQILKHIVAIMQDKSLHFLHLTAASVEFKTSSSTMMTTSSHHHNNQNHNQSQNDTTGSNNNSNNNGKARNKVTKPSLLLLCLQIIDKLLHNTSTASTNTTNTTQQHTPTSSVPLLTLNLLPSTTSASVLFLQERYNKEKLWNQSMDRALGVAGGITTTTTNTAATSSSSSSSSSATDLMSLYTMLAHRLEEIWIQLTINEESLLSRSVVTILSHILQIWQAFLSSSLYWQYQFLTTSTANTTVGIASLMKTISHITMYYPYISREASLASPGSECQIDGNFMIELFNLKISDFVYFFQQQYLSHYHQYHQEQVRTTSTNLTTTTNAIATTSLHSALQQIQSYQLEFLHKLSSYLITHLDHQHDVIATHTTAIATIATATATDNKIYFSFDQIKELLLKILSIVPYLLTHCEQYNDLFAYFTPLTHLLTCYTNTYCNTTANSVVSTSFAQHLPILTTLMKIVLDMIVDITNEPTANVIVLMSSSIFVLFVKMTRQCIALITTCCSFHSSAFITFQLFEQIVTCTRQLILSYEHYQTNHITNTNEAEAEGTKLMEHEMNTLYDQFKGLIVTSNHHNHQLVSSGKVAYDFLILPSHLKTRVLDVWSLLPSSIFLSFLPTLWNTFFSTTSSTATAAVDLGGLTSDVQYFVCILLTRCNEVKFEDTIKQIFQTLDHLIVLCIQNNTAAGAGASKNTETTATQDESAAIPFALYEQMMSIFPPSTGSGFVAILSSCLDVLFATMEQRLLQTEEEERGEVLEACSDLLLGQIATWLMTNVPLTIAHHSIQDSKVLMNHGKQSIVFQMVSRMIAYSTTATAAMTTMTADEGEEEAEEEQEWTKDWFELAKQCIRVMVNDFRNLYNSVDRSMALASTKLNPTNSFTTMAHLANDVFIDSVDVFVSFLTPMARYTLAMMKVTNTTSSNTWFAEQLWTVLIPATTKKMNAKDDDVVVLDETFETIYFLRCYYFALLRLPMHYYDDLEVRSNLLTCFQTAAKGYHQGQLQHCMGFPEQQRVIDNAMLDVYNLFA